jgi:hypothetical protein
MAFALQLRKSREKPQSGQPYINIQQEYIGITIKIHNLHYYVIILKQSAQEGGKVVSPTHRPPLASRKYSWYLFLLEAESTPGP